MNGPTPKGLPRRHSRPLQGRLLPFALASVSETYGLDFLHLRPRLSSRGVGSAPPTTPGKGSTFPARPSPFSLPPGEARPRRALTVACATPSYPGLAVGAHPRVASASSTARWTTDSFQCGGGASPQQNVKRLAAMKRRGLFTEQWAEPHRRLLKPGRDAAHARRA